MKPIQALLFGCSLALVAVLASFFVHADTVPLWYTQGDSLKATITKSYLVFGKVTFNRNGTIGSITLTSPKVGANGISLDSVEMKGSTPDTLLIYTGGKVAKVQLN